MKIWEIGVVHKPSTQRFVMGFKKYLDQDFDSRKFQSSKIKNFTMFMLSEQTTVRLFPPNAKTHDEMAGIAIAESASPIDLPFPNVILESEHGFGRLDLRGDTTKSIVLYSVACREVAIGQYDFDCFGAYSPSVGQVRVENFLPDKPDLLRYIIRRVFNDRKARFGEEKSGRHIKIKGRHGSRYEMVKPIVHVVLDGDYQPSESEDGEPIDWQHSWQVRGHWRVCGGLGKDRDGEYCITGYTWVREHVKGDGPLIKKTRITEVIHA